MSRILVTAGPTISHERVRELLPQAEVVAPIAFRDAGNYQLMSGDLLLIIDGLFMQTAPVRHKEILDLLAQGVEVWGSSSMGALRAAELWPWGMVGIGGIYEEFRNGKLVADDEVGVLHAPEESEWLVFADALVNTRQILTRACEAGTITEVELCELLAVAQTTCFTERDLHTLLARSNTEIDKERARSLRRWMRDNNQSRKLADAEEALTLLHSGARTLDFPEHNPPRRPLPERTLFPWIWERRIEASTIEDRDVLYWHRLTRETSRQQHQEALREVLSMWLDEDLHEAAPETLVTKAHAYAIANGHCDEDSFPDEVVVGILTTQQIEDTRNDPAMRTYLTMTQQMFRPPLVPIVDEVGIEILKRNGQWPLLLDEVKEAFTERDAFAKANPNLNLLAIQLPALLLLLTEFWQTDAGEEALLRGWMTLEALAADVRAFVPHLLNRREL